jgi:hypothetical protein
MLMPWLIHAELATARERQLRESAPTLILDSAGLNALLLHLGHEALHVSA